MSALRATLDDALELIKKFQNASWIKRFFRYSRSNLAQLARSVLSLSSYVWLYFIHSIRRAGNSTPLCSHMLLHPLPDPPTPPDYTSTVLIRTISITWIIWLVCARDTQISPPLSPSVSRSQSIFSQDFRTTLNSFRLSVIG